MSANKLIVNPKDYKLKCSEEVLKTIKPYFELKASSYSHYINSHQSSPNESNPDQKALQPKQESKTTIHLTLRDANSGELLGKGSLIYDHTQEKPEKFEESVTLKDILGNEIGQAIVEVQQIKPQEPKRSSIEDEFRRMRKEMHGMMTATNRLFDSFSRRHFGRDWGFGLLDDFSPFFALGEDHDDVQERHTQDQETGKKKSCQNCKCNEEKPKQNAVQKEDKSMIEKLNDTSASIIELATEPVKEVEESRRPTNIEMNENQPQTA